MGDGIQAAKAGILEVADVFVVNKADRDGADQTVRDLRYMQSLGGRHSEPGALAAADLQDRRLPGDRQRHRRACSAKIEEHRRVAGVLRRGAPAPRASGPPARSRPSRWPALRERMGDVHGSAALGSLAEPVVAGETDPYRAADELLAQL